MIDNNNILFYYLKANLRIGRNATNSEKNDRIEEALNDVNKT